MILFQNGPVELLGIRLIGVTPENGRKLLLTIGTLLALWIVARLLRLLIRGVMRHRFDLKARFWTGQGLQMITTLLAVIILVSIWFDEPGRIGTIIGLASAGIAISLSKVITALAGYFVILRSGVFNVGDRIAMGGVRGDVISLGYLRTTILEMGQTPSEQADDPGMWVQARQYTGRIVTVTNDKVFEEPVYNYSRDFPFILEEIKVGISYRADRKRAEQILLDVARKHTLDLSDVGEETLEELRRRYFIPNADLAPRVYLRFTDDWLELAVRFVAPTHGTRDLKDRIYRDILAGYDQAGIAMSSRTIDIVGLPPIRLETAQ